MQNGLTSKYVGDKKFQNQDDHISILINFLNRDEKILFKSNIVYPLLIKALWEDSLGKQRHIHRYQKYHGFFWIVSLFVQILGKTQGFYWTFLSKLLLG